MPRDLGYLARLRLTALIAAAFAALLLPATGVAGTRILGPPHASVHRAQAWARANGAMPTFVRLAPLYWRLAPKRGIRPEVAYGQSAKETGFGRFGGVLDASFHNPCGLKRTAGGGNYDKSAHRRFRTWRQGVTAHLDHLALYTVQALGGAWAPSASYGHEVLVFARQIGLGNVRPVRRPRVVWAVPAPHFARGISV